MDAKGMAIAAIDCRFDGVSASGVSIYAMKITWKKPEKVRRIHWHIGNKAEMAYQDRIQRAKGLHRVFTKNIYHAASGRRASCAMWEK